MTSTMPAMHERSDGSSIVPAAKTTNHGASAPVTTRRQLACIFCQQRKVKCDHHYPCGTCVKARVQCVQVAPQTKPRRRRRFPERELLARLRLYENIMTRHNVPFEPMHPSGTADVALENGNDKESPASAASGRLDDESDDDDSVVKWPDALLGENNAKDRQSSGKIFESKRMYETLRQEDPTAAEDDEIESAHIKKAWDENMDHDDELFLGWPQNDIPLYTLHPQPVQLFQLWQIYLDNINPLLKVTHVPSLQSRIVAAASNILAISPELEALMFSIYCIAVNSLTDDVCRHILAQPKQNLLAAYQLGCKQALRKARFLRSTSRDTLTAFYLYLVSVKFNTTPESLSAMLGIVLRIAQRMGYHNETALAKLSMFEAEMGRRLWWSFILLDMRVGELTHSAVSMPSPRWDCGIPSNINDSDLRPETRELPTIQGKFTDTLFAVVRSELGEWVRTTTFHLGYYGPSHLSTNNDPKDGAGLGEVARLERSIEAKYLKFCDLSNPLHFMTYWTTRGTFAKFHLQEHHYRYSGTSLHQAETQREAALSYAIDMLEASTKLTACPLTKGYLWMVQSYYPFVGYIQIVQYLKWRPMNSGSERAWQVMSENFHANMSWIPLHRTFFELLAGFVMQAWDALVAASTQTGSIPETPEIISTIKMRLAQLSMDKMSQGLHLPADILSDVLDLPSTIVTGSTLSATQDDFATYPNLEYTAGGIQAGNANELSLQDMQMHNVDWSSADWLTFDASMYPHIGETI